MADGEFAVPRGDVCVELAGIMFSSADVRRYRIKMEDQ